MLYELLYNVGLGQTHVVSRSYAGHTSKYLDLLVYQIHVISFRSITNEG